MLLWYFRIPIKLLYIYTRYEIEFDKIDIKKIVYFAKGKPISKTLICR